MIRSYLLIGIIVTVAACSSNTPIKGDSATPTATAAPSPNGEAGRLLADTVKVKQWLTAVIEKYTNSPDPHAGFDSLRAAFTEDYYEYKQGALNLQYDNGDTTLTEAAFKEKWQHKYNIKLVGEGGYIISSQDNGKVKVKACQLIGHTGEASMYKVVIEDLDFTSTFHRDFKIVSRNGKLLIDDVLEYD